MGLLHRRHLRLKTLHALYAHYQNDNGEVTGLKNLQTGIAKVHELYVLMLDLVAELHTFAQQRAEENRKDKKGLAATQLPEEVFAENRILTALANSEELQAKVKAFKIDWLKNDPDIIDGIFRTFSRSEEYKNYIKDTEKSLSKDKKIIQKIFRKYIVNSEALQKHLEEQSIFWSDDLDLVAVNVLKTLDAIEENGALELMSLYKDFDEDAAFVKNLFSRTLSGYDDNEALIEQLAKNWDAERIALMDRLIMTMAITEMTQFPDIPVKVSLNEYIDLAKEYSTNKSKNFVNGILDKAIQTLREQEKINKTGRGLME